MNEAKQIADFIASLGPSALLGIALYLLAKKYQSKEDALTALQQAKDALQEKRVEEQKANATAMLQLAQGSQQIMEPIKAALIRVVDILERVEERLNRP